MLEAFYVLPYVVMTSLCMFGALSLQTRQSIGAPSLGRSAVAPATGASHSNRPRYHNPPAAAVVIVSAILVVFSGARVDVGSDFRLYATIYAQIPEDLNLAISQTHQEIGFTVLTWALRRSFGASQAFFWVTALLTVLMYIVAIRTRRSPFAPSIFIYITGGAYLFALNGVRQGIAVAILFLAFSATSQRTTRFFVTIIVAAFFHATAIIGGAAFIVARSLKWNRRSVMIAVVAGTGGVALMANAPLFVGLVSGINPKYDIYLGAEWRDTAGVGTVLNVAFAIAVAAYVGFKERGRNEYDAEKWVLLFAAIMSAGAWISPPIARIAEYWLPVAIYTIPKILERENVTTLEKLCVYSSFGIHGAAYVIWFSGLIPYMWSL